MELSEINGQFVDSVIKEYLDKLNQCLTHYDELFCVHIPTGKSFDGDMNVSIVLFIRGKVFKKKFKKKTLLEVIIYNRGKIKVSIFRDYLYCKC